MARVKVFYGQTNINIESEVNEWNAKVEPRGAEILQIAVTDGGEASGVSLWILYKGP